MWNACARAGLRTRTSLLERAYCPDAMDDPSISCWHYGANCANQHPIGVSCVL